MRSSLLTSLCFGLLAAATVAHGDTISYEADPNWLKLPEGRTEIGSMHGDIAVSAAGEVYMSVEGTVRQRYAILGPNPGIQVYSLEGKYLRQCSRRALRPARVPDSPGAGR